VNYKFLFISALLFQCLGCINVEMAQDSSVPTFIKGADLSFVPEALSANVIYKYNNELCDPIKLLKQKGGNYIRVRLWHSPTNSHSSFEEVRELSKRIRAAEMNLWLTVHYSDTWADPGHQQIPQAWANLSFQQLKIEMANYTRQIMREIKPDIIQIGNEINSGFLHPHGHLIQQEAQCLDLIKTAITVVNNERRATKVMLHFAGIDGANWFFNKMTGLNFDLIGLSYYPIWHGQNLNLLNQTITQLGQQHQKPVILAETSYPFTLGWNDWTNNVVGLNEHLIPAYPATPQGQKDYMLALKNLISSNIHAKGFCYWGGEWTAFRGPQATNGSSWENQAFWDFSNNALPILDVYED
jgi:arabinogalactan endo-1,4-beta-galactosidase